MKSMHDAGEAMILAHQGQLQLAGLLRAGVARLWARGMGRVARLLNRTNGRRPYTR